MPLLVRAFPLRRPVEDLQSFTAELAGPRKSDAEAFYRAHGVSHESWYLQDTPQGPLVIGLTRVDDPEHAATQFGATQQGFARWFKDQVMALSGVDQDSMPEGPPTRLVYEWHAGPETRAMFAPPQR